LKSQGKKKNKIKKIKNGRKDTEKFEHTPKPSEAALVSVPAPV
jgi:hypothetical protein